MKELLIEVAEVLAEQNWRGDLQERLKDAAAIAPPVAAGSVDLHKLVIEAQDRAEKAEAELAHKQAIIDRLMLEYCPDEMTAEQVKEWGEHQVRAE